jgi:hypothetical protein
MALSIGILGPEHQLVLLRPVLRQQVLPQPVLQQQVLQQLVLQLRVQLAGKPLTSYWLPVTQKLRLKAILISFLPP